VSRAGRGQRWLIVCGHPRSGTSMLRDVLNTHPSVMVTFERRLFQPQAPLWVYARRLRRPAAGWGALFPSGAGRARPRGGRWRFMLRLLRHAWRVRVDDAGAALASTSPGVAIVGDKWPQYIFRLDRFARERNLLRVVIYRDCRDVVQSVRAQRARRNKLRRPDSEPGAIAAAWVRAMGALERNRERVHAIRYEDFVADPHRHLGPLGAYLGVPAGGFDVSRVGQGGVGIWRERLSPAEVDAIMRVAGETMARWSYT
jgi:hypothetical protein